MLTHGRPPPAERLVSAVQSNADHHYDGRPTFVLGVYNVGNATFTNVTRARAVDVGVAVAYGQLSTEGGLDARTLHISWLIDHEDPQPPDCNGGGQLTSFRELQFDPRLGILVERPIAECAVQARTLSLTPTLTLSLTTTLTLSLTPTLTLSLTTTLTLSLTTTLTLSLTPTLTLSLTTTLTLSLTTTLTLSLTPTLTLSPTGT